jgi:hypothetical protein
MKNGGWSVLTVGLFLCGCEAPPEDFGTAQQALVGGATSSSDSAVALISADYGAAGIKWFSGVTVGPRALLTCAHDLVFNGLMPKVGVTFDSSHMVDPTSSLPLNGNLHFTVNSAFDRAHPLSGHDNAVVYLDSDAPAIMAYYGGAPKSTWIGQDARLIGYGQTASNVDDVGFRRTISTPVSDISGHELVFNGPKGNCEGDSGGPALLEITGAEVVVALATAAEPGCTGKGYYTLFDSDLPFINAQVAGAPPSGGGGSTGGTTPPKSGGCDVSGGSSESKLPAIFAATLLLFFLRRRAA